MTFEELDQRFPNGLDDAHITGIFIDYGADAATLTLSMRMNPAESQERNIYGPATLKATGIYYLAIEPPDSEHLRYPKHGKITISGFPEDLAKFPLAAKVKPLLPASAFCCRFFVHDWNSFIHIASESADFFCGNEP